MIKLYDAYIDALLTNLSKAFDCLNHDLLIAKLHAYGLDIDLLNILQDYLWWLAWLI